jgi:tetratricopeptide (TPR) repeat protein
MPHSTNAARDEEQQTLESGVPLSQSLIWRLQRDFYTDRGLKAWTEDMVPHYITNNPFIAEIYAQIIFHFLCDCGLAASGNSKSVQILELGAGSGKFSYLFLRQLTSLLREHDIPLARIRYCMTDCAENILQAWQGNPWLSEFVASGILEFRLLRAGEEANAGSGGSGPLVVIANYVFDSLPQDAFVIKDGAIAETVVTTRRPGEGDLSSLQFSYENVAVQPQHYPDLHWNTILEYYRTHLSAATVLFPSQTLKTMQELSNLSDGRMLVLAADKGYAHEDQLGLSQGIPTLEFHNANCFSQMVNFDAIGKYFQAIGGTALLPDKHFASISICAFLQHGPEQQFPATSKAYRNAQENFGPDDLFALLAWLNAHMEETSVAQILSVSRLSRWDPVALVRLFPVLARQFGTVIGERYDLRNAVLRTWVNFYPVHPDDNVLPFYCGAILLQLRFYEEALPMFKASQQLFGPSAATSYNLGLCLMGLNRNVEALTAMSEVCSLDPAFEPAKQMRKQLEKELE